MYAGPQLHRNGADASYLRGHGVAYEWGSQDLDAMEKLALELGAANRTISPATDTGGYSWIRLATPSA